MRHLLIAVALTILSASPSLAWKPTTHNYFASIAVDDALDGSNVTIDIIGEAPKVYKLRKEVYEVLRDARPYYRAGVLGPDAYPDIWTGQRSIHGRGDLWLQHIWADFGKTPQEQAFRLGFLTHAAGDMYAHSFVNEFSGGDFTINPISNAARHVVIESYVDVRLPKEALKQKSFFSASIKGLEEKIYTSMLDAKPGSALAGTLLEQPSFPGIFSTLRYRLADTIISNTQKITELDAIIASCGTGDLTCGLLQKAERIALDLATQYLKRWVEDIDSGLKALPEVSHEIAVATFFNEDHKQKFDVADAKAKAYAQDHVISMIGFPDKVGEFVGIARAIIDQFVPKSLSDLFNALQTKFYDTILEKAYGMTLDQYKSYVTAPATVFDYALNEKPLVGFKPLPESGGNNISIEAFNRDHLKITDTGNNDPDEAFDYRKFPAAYNTVMMSKLILLSPKSINDLISRLGGKAKLTEENVMLGFMPSLDGSWQWRLGMVLAQDCVVYDKLFMPLPGNGGCKK